MPEEILVLFVLMILGTFTLTFTSMILRHKRKRRQANESAEGSSMTTSELESLMRRAVEDATAPLSEKVKDLELELARLQKGQNQLEAHDPSSRIELEDEVLDVEPVKVGPRTRT